MTMQISRKYVSDLIMLGVESPTKMTLKQSSNLLSYIVEELTDDDFIEYLIEAIDPAVLQRHFIFFLRFDRHLDRGALLHELKSDLRGALNDIIETLFMDELECNENERLDFNNLNYSHSNVHYL